MDLNSNKGNLLIYTTPEARDRFHEGMIGSEYKNSNPKDLSKLKYPDKTYIDVDKYTGDEIKAYVRELVSEAEKNSIAIDAEATANGVEFGSIVAKDRYNDFYYLDFASRGTDPNGTYYVNFKEGEYGKARQYDNNGNFVQLSSWNWGQLHINKLPGQTIILNIPDTTVEFGQFFVNGVNTNADASEDDICQNIIFNCPNATQARTMGPTDGVFLCPKADFKVDIVAAGWLVANKISKIGGQEWHCIYKDLPESDNVPVEVNFKAVKRINGQPIKNADEYDDAFKFTLELGNNKNQTWQLLETVNNVGQDITFNGYTINEEGTYFFRIKESGYTHDEYQNKVKLDTVSYLAKVVVGSTVESVSKMDRTVNVTKLNVESIEYFKGDHPGADGSTDGLEKIPELNAVVFDNPTVDLSLIHI